MKTNLDQLDVRIQKLSPMQVARFHAVGRSPEEHAWIRLHAWAEPRGLLRDLAAHPVFGFNNPSPTSADQDYGYEFWIKIEPGAVEMGDAELLNFSGGWYAVTTCPGFPTPAVWMRLLSWVQNSTYRHRREHELERPHDPAPAEPEMVFDLYLPIEAPEVLERTNLGFRGVDFVRYPVTDLDRAARFYREILGLSQELYSEQWQWAEFNCGNVTLALHGGVKLPGSVAGGTIALAVEDVQTACAELKRQGVQFVQEAVEYGPCCAAEILDPDGNRIILHQRADGTWG